MYEGYNLFVNSGCSCFIELLVFYNLFTHHGWKCLSKCYALKCMFAKSISFCLWLRSFSLWQWYKIGLRTRQIDGYRTYPGPTRNSRRGCISSRYIYILSTKFYGGWGAGGEKEQHEDKFKKWKVTAMSKLVNKCIEPFAIKIVKFIVCWLKNILFVVSEVWNIVKNMMSGKKIKL